jgi:hypothetical protein
LTYSQIQDIIDFAESYNVEGAIVFVDFKKAFGSLEWTPRAMISTDKTNSKADKGQP